MLIPTAQNTKTITDMREDAVGLLNLSKKRGPVYLLHRSEPAAVMLSIREFRKILDTLEDLADENLALQAEQDLKNNNLDNYVSFDQILKKLNINREDL